MQAVGSLNFPNIEVSFTKEEKCTGVSGIDTHLDKIWESFLTSWAREAAIIDMNGHMILQQIKAVKGFWAKNARISLLVRMELHVALQGRTADEALVTEITGQRAVPLPPVETQMLVQFVLFPEGLPTLQTLKRPERLSNKQMLKSCVLKDTHKQDHSARSQAGKQLAHLQRKRIVSAVRLFIDIKLQDTQWKDFSGEDVKTKPMPREDPPGKQTFFMSYDVYEYMGLFGFFFFFFF